MTGLTTISDVIRYFETLAPGALQESYDNSGLQVGDPSQEVSSVLVTLDVTEEVLDEAIRLGSNLVVAHHPVIFKELKKITCTTATGRVLMKAIRNKIAILAVHTNLDNAEGGVNSMIARKLGLINLEILQPLKGNLRKLVTFIPSEHLVAVRQAVFTAGAGNIGNYDQCSFTLEGKGSFRGNEMTHPYAGKPGKLHVEPEVRLETIYPEWLEKEIIDALLTTHPYEEVAYDIYSLGNHYMKSGAGITGDLPEEMEETRFLEKLRDTFHIPVIRHSPLLHRPVKKVALCGGAGSFLLKEAIASGSDFFITGDIRYHQFFGALDHIVMADIGHFESEQYTKELFYESLIKKFPTFAVHLSEINTNPVEYYQ